MYKIYLVIIICLILTFPLRVLSQESFWINRGAIGSVPFNNCISILPDNTILIGANDGLYKSTNDGMNFARINPPLYDVYRMARNDTNGVLFLTLRSSSPSSNGVFRSYDNGNSWSPAGLFSNDGRAINDLKTKENGLVFTASFDPNDSKGGVHRSTDNGTSWTYILPIYDVSCLFVDKNGFIYAGTTTLDSYADPYLLKSVDNGNNWYPIFRIADGGSLVTNVSVSDNGYIYVYTNHGSIYRSTNSGTNWQEINSSVAVNLLLNNSYNYLYALRNSDLIYSTNFGSNWYNTEGIEGTCRYMTINSQGLLYALGYNTLYKSRFSTLSPFAPMLIYPLNAADSVVLTPTVTWSSSTHTTDYRIRISADSLFNNLIVNQSGIIQTQYSVPVGKLNYITKYYWKINASNQYGEGFSSEIRFFRTAPLAAPPAPILLSPINNSINQPPTVLLDWDSLASANSYRIQIATDSLFNSINYDTSDVKQTFLYLRSGILLAGTKYYWRINASNLSGTSPWSVIWNFRVNPTNINLFSFEIPREFKLYNNYPNPFNPVTIIKFDIPKTEFITIKIYDILSKEVETLVKEKLSPGSYSVDWNASEYPSGVYFYRLSTGNFTQTKRMILLK